MIVLRNHLDVGASGQILPSTASRTAGTLKRTSSGAGLPQQG